MDIKIVTAKEKDLVFIDSLQKKNLILCIDESKNFKSI